MTLKDLQPGESGRIESVGGEGALRQHFLDMGVLPGADVTVTKLAPMGDPMELRNHGYEARLTIDGMTCANCARKVENALNRMDGSWATFSIAQHEARLLSKEPPDEKAIRQAMQQAGYVVMKFEQR